MLTQWNASFLQVVNHHFSTEPMRFPASGYSTVRLDVIHSLTQVPVIVAEIGAQSVDIQDQSHGAAQQFCKHFCLARARGNTNKNKTKQTGKWEKIKKIKKMQSETQRSSESRFLVPLSPRLCQDVSAKTSPFSPPHHPRWSAQSG